jgi:putative membrane protein
MITTQAARVVAAALLSGAFAAVWSGNAGATGHGGDEDRSVHATPLSNRDDQFLHEAYSINAGEVKLGELAEEKGTTAQVKAFAHRMVKDHTLALDHLNKVAHEGHFAVPDRLLPAQAALYDQLSDLSGKNFDSAYVQHMVTGHEQAIGIFEREANSGENGALRRFAQHELPTLRTHEDLAKFDAEHPAP